MSFFTVVISKGQEFLIFGRDSPFLGFFVFLPEKIGHIFTDEVIISFSNEVFSVNS